MNKSKYLSLFTTLFLLWKCTFSTPAFAIDPIQEWDARYDQLGGEDVPVGIAVDTVGNTYLTGYSRKSGAPHYDWVTAKYDASGNQLWLKFYNGPTNQHDKPAAIAVDGTGNVYVTGSSSGVGTNYDYVTIKYNTNGQVVWSRTYNNATMASAALDTPTALTVDASGNVYVTGASVGNNTLEDYVTVKYDRNGNQLWVGRYNDGGGADIPTAIGVDGSGNVFVTGRSVGKTTRTYDYATVKYSAGGRQLWAVRYNGPASSNAQDYAQALAIDGNGNVIVTGYSNATNGRSDYTTIKYDTSGNALWNKRYDGTAHTSDEANAIAVDAAGNIYVTGWSYTLWGSTPTGPKYVLPGYATVKYASSGNELWARTYNGPQGVGYAKALALDAAGDVYVTGTSILDNGPRYFDCTTVKYDTNGGQQWVSSYYGTAPYRGLDTAIDIAVDELKNVYITGSSDGNGTGMDYATVKYVQP